MAEDIKDKKMKSVIYKAKGQSEYQEDLMDIPVPESG